MAVEVARFFSRRALRLLCILTIILSEAPIQANADNGTGVSIEFDAVAPSITSGSWTGHAFLCMRYGVNQGSKEDCYGFYPAKDGVGLIFGPGVVSAEPTPDHANRFAFVAISTQRAISLEQRRAVLREIDTWNSARFNLTDHNCIDFIDTVARLASFNVPDRTSLQFPIDYVRLLATLNP